MLYSSVITVGTCTFQHTYFLFVRQEVVARQLLAFRQAIEDIESLKSIIHNL